MKTESAPIETHRPRKLRQLAAPTLVAAAMLVTMMIPLAPGRGAAGAAGDTRPGVSDMVADAMRMEQMFVRMFNEKKLDELGTAYYSEDALAIPPNHEPIRGRAAIVEYLRGLRDGMGELEGGTEAFGASASGNLVSLVGKYSVRSGKVRFTSHEVYERQPDGSLRCTVDMFGLRDPLA